MTSPVLRVRTERLEYDGPLLEWADALHPLVFLRNGDGLVGFGERIGYRHSGVDRVAGLAQWWRELCEGAEVSDAVGMPGTGLVAFGSCAFTDGSAAPSILSVPAVVVGRRDGVTWITRIDSDDPVGPTALGVGFGTVLSPGAMSPSAFEAAVATATAAIGARRARKVVVARDLVGDIPATADRRVVLDRLSTAYPDTFTFAVDGLVGSSPETLVRVRDGEVSARVLAGTARRGVDAAADATAESSLAHSAKDLGEHDLAVRSLLDALGPHATSVGTTGPYPLRLPNLWHLATDVRGELVPGNSALDLVAALHPTAAVAGTPTDAALALIAELEWFDRGRYAGPVGWVDAAGDGEWAIALRCALIDSDGHVTAWAGAGIVADSDPATELAETELKFRPMIDALTSVE